VKRPPEVHLPVSHRFRSGLLLVGDMTARGHLSVE